MNEVFQKICSRFLRTNTSVVLDFLRKLYFKNDVLLGFNRFSCEIEFRRPPLSEF